jgi:hypothetical protein
VLLYVLAAPAVSHMSPTVLPLYLQLGEAWRSCTELLSEGVQCYENDPARGGYICYMLRGVITWLMQLRHAVA